MADGGTRGKTKILLYKQAIVAYGAAIAGLPSQIAYGGWQKNCHAISARASIALPFNNTGIDLPHNTFSVTIYY